MLTYFPKYLSNKCIAWYLITLLAVSIIFYDYSLPFYLISFGIISVIVFFYFSNDLSVSWSRCSPKVFEKKILYSAFIIRAIYVIFIYNLNYALYDTFYESSPGDICWYVPTAEYLAQHIRDGSFNMNILNTELPNISDAGYVLYLTFVYVFTLDFGTVIIPLLLKSFMGAYTCVFIYRIATRHFGDSVGKLAAIFCVLQFNMIWWCGSMMKETEMVFFTMLFVEKADQLMYYKQFRYMDLLPLAILGLWVFTFRSALGLCLFASLLMTILLSPNKTIKHSKKIVIIMSLSVILLLFAGSLFHDTIMETYETVTSSHQEVNMEWRSRRENGNAFAKYAGATVFAPLIFTIPFPSMVYTFQGQEMIMQVNGGNYIKNVLSFFVIYAMFWLLFTKEWRKHILPIAVLCSYLVALVLSEFAQSGRFHMPILPLEMMFAAFGLSVIKKKHLNWFNYALVFEFVICIAWAWFKLAGRGNLL